MAAMDVKQFERDVKEMFEMFDKDSDKCLSLDELGYGLKKLGMKIPHRDLQVAMKKIDKNGNGRIELEEFKTFMLKQFKKKSGSSVQDSQVRQAFALFDKDGNGVIDRLELRRAMHGLGETLTDLELDMMMDEADKNNDGKIDFEEFRKMWYSKIAPDA